MMLKVYSAVWCPHCQKTEAYLREHHIPFESIDIEKQPDAVVQKVVDVNGGEDWVVPTLEFNGQWRPGEVFNPAKLDLDLRNLGVVR
jgi:mycoredoxin